MNQQTIDDLTVRLKELERNARATKMVFAMIVLSTGIACIIGMRLPDKKTITANEFILVDDEGRTRARLFVDKTKKGPSLIFFDSKKQPRIRLGIEKNTFSNSDESTLTFMGGDGNPRIVLENSGNNNYLSFASEGKQGELVLRSGKSYSELELTPLFYKNDAFPVLIRSTANGAELSLWDKFRTFPNNTHGYQSRIVLQNRGAKSDAVIGASEIVIEKPITSNETIDLRVFVAGSPSKEGHRELKKGVRDLSTRDFFKDLKKSCRTGDGTSDR